MKHYGFHLTAMSLAILAAASAGAVTPPAGYLYGGLVLSNTTQSCLAVGPGGTFVGVGPGFKANANAVVFVQESGATRLVALGFNSLSDCAYDAASDTLYVTDNADSGELAGALTGDTIFRISSASTASSLPASGIELLPANSVPAAAGIAVDTAGDVYVGNAAGGGAGSVLKIDLPGVTSAPFVTGLDLTGGLAFEAGSGDLFAAETTSCCFESQIEQYDSLGAPLGTFAGPSGDFGSYDLALNTDGRLLATGDFSGELVSFDNLGSPTVLTTGLSFTSGVTVNDFTGRIEVLSSAFPATAENRTIHRLTPISRLIAGKGSARNECVNELYGLELVAPAPGRPATQAICTDGAPCDADGKENDRCLFPVGFCLNVTDPDFPDCTPGSVTAFSAQVKPNPLEASTAVAAITAALPLTGPQCFFSDGITVPVKITASGKKAGKGKVLTKAKPGDDDVDTDSVVLVCNPAP